MINNTLAFFTPGPYEILVILVILVFLAIPIILVIVFAQLLLRNKKENIRLRLEVGKLADEIEQLRKQKDGEQDATTIKSV